jgi:hypothetical protein
VLKRQKTQIGLVEMEKGQKQGLLVCHLLLYWSSTSFGLLLAFIRIEDMALFKTHDWYSYEKKYV